MKKKIFRELRVELEEKSLANNAAFPFELVTKPSSVLFWMEIGINGVYGREAYCTPMKMGEEFPKAVTISVVIVPNLTGAFRSGGCTLKGSNTEISAWSDLPIGIEIVVL